LDRASDELEKVRLEYRDARLELQQEVRDVYVYTMLCTCTLCGVRVHYAVYVYTMRCTMLV
jgi:hypothetical protein